MGLPHHADLMFASHHRRPLKSKTYDTFLRLLSLSNHPSFSSAVQDDNGSRKAQELCPTESHNTLVDSESVRDDRKEDASFTNKQSSPELIARKKDKEENQGLGDIVDLVVDKGNGSDPVSESISKPHNPHCMSEVRSSSLSPEGELKGNEEFSVMEVCEAIDRSLHVDAAAQLSRHGESGQYMAAVDEQNMSVETEQELQRREMELEKLIMSSDFVNASPFPSLFEDIEEGELSGDMGIDDISVDMLSKYDTLPTAESAENLQAFNNSSDGKEFAHDVGQSEIERSKVHTPLLDAITRDNDTMEVDGKRCGENQFHKSGSDNVNSFDIHQAHSHGGRLLEISGRKEQPGEINWPNPAGDNKSESVVENQSSAAAEKDDDAPKNKRKRGPLTKERKEKRKKRERTKRAQKNRMLGVKRLKLQPMVKPKAVSYCRHYMKGRCQEGEKCKFSHDTVPLTKSTPCCHFARHSCMKGDDCPFDHQLSKYPCNNYASKGFCSRGVDCLFSHENPPKETRQVVSYAEACEMKTPLASSNPTPSTSQKVEAKSCAAVKIQSIQPPKGVNILVHGHMSTVSMGKQLDSRLSNTDSGDKTVQSVAQNLQKVNEVGDKAVARTPRGINFLSFGKSPTSGSNAKVVSILPPVTDSRNGSSALVTRTPNGDDATKSDSQCRPIISPPSVPRGVNFISIGKSSNNRTPGEPLNPQPSRSQSQSTSIPEEERASERSQIPMPSKSPSSFTFKSTVDSEVSIASSSKSSFLSETSPMAHKALHSTLSFAANVEPLMKLNSSSKTPFGNRNSASFQSDQTNASTVLDFLYGSDCKPKT